MSSCHGWPICMGTHIVVGLGPTRVNSPTGYQDRMGAPPMGVPYCMDLARVQGECLVLWVYDLLLYYLSHVFVFSISQVLVGSAPLKPDGFDKGCKHAYKVVRVLRPIMSRCIRIGHIRVSGTAVSRKGGNQARVGCADSVHSILTRCKQTYKHYWHYYRWFSVICFLLLPLVFCYIFADPSRQICSPPRGWGWAPSSSSINPWCCRGSCTAQRSLGPSQRHRGHNWRPSTMAA